MLPDFLTTAFELLHGNQATVFRRSIYFPAGVALIVITVLAMVFFYYGLGAVRARYARISYWLLTAAVAALLCVISAMVVVHATDGIGMMDAVSVSFYLVDGIYALLLFSLLSTLFKWWSPNARRTPF